MIRRCPQCGSNTDDMYGFCIKCGYEFSNSETSENTCPLCGFENPDEADYCVKCGTPLVFKNSDKKPNTPLNPIVIKTEVVKDAERIKNQTPRWIIILGYFFTILGGILGLIIAIYLSTRKDPVARKHGHIQLAIFIFYLIILIILFATGRFPYEAYEPYARLLSGNFTR